MKVRSHVKHTWHSCVIFLLVMKVFKLSLMVVYCDRNMYLLYNNGKVVLTAFIWSRLKKLAPQIVRSVPELATKVLRTPDDGRDGGPKTCRVI